MKSLEMKTISKIFLLLAVVLVFSYCSSEDDDGLGTYYTGTFNDSINIFSSSDTVNILLEQWRNHLQKENVPYSFEANNNDTVQIKLFVSFGSYDEHPVTVKDIKQISDTFYVWYSLINKNSKILNKSNSITGVNTSPRISYVSVDSVVIYKKDNKIVNFISVLR
ncbi:MAG: hypothetical protein RBR74_01480 [Ignavibacteriaceae bacterium]|jgi:hypothetical protein|nr:hypothetical protein [Ignavibacteriaceae bacterium]